MSRGRVRAGLYMVQSKEKSHMRGGFQAVDTFQWKEDVLVSKELPAPWVVRFPLAYSSQEMIWQVAFTSMTLGLKSWALGSNELSRWGGRKADGRSVLLGSSGSCCGCDCKCSSVLRSWTLASWPQSSCTVKSYTAASTATLGPCSANTDRVCPWARLVLG